MPVIHRLLEIHKVEKILRNQKFGFRLMQGGWFQLTKPSTTAFRSDGTPFYDPCPGLISPQVQERILTYARNENEAAAQFVAIGTQAVTDPVLADEPVQAPALDMEAIARVAETIAENKLSDLAASMRADNQKQVEAVLAENAKLRQRLDDLEAGAGQEEPEVAAKGKKKGKGKAKGHWRNQPAPTKQPESEATGKPPEPPIDFGDPANAG